MTDDGVNDAPALKKADIGSAVADSTDAACSASDIVLIEPGLSAIISAVLTSRAIFQGMKNYTTAFTDKKDFGKGVHEAAMLADQRPVSGLKPSEMRSFTEKSTFREINVMSEEAKRHVEISRQRVIHALKGKVESFAKLRGYDIDAMNNHYTL
ncbi:hypothetical protein LWI29_020492 [Acer saccharum]|uniref:Uncharacterized protein n=1 Tax=Acer saccharum TaxID=4024 RepID=A0AA39RN91_ACESA|nr:hypothetical protein LWI29_020492 [Acer saccharum]